MSRSVLVVGWTWNDGGVVLRSWTGGQPGAPARVPKDEVLSGTISFRIRPGRYCTGHHDGTGWRACPDGSRASRGSMCGPCFGRDAFRPCMTCDGLRCPRLSRAILEYCQSDHHMYLACFGDDTVKVGTAVHRRRDQRIIEQGPLAAARVARAPGPRIKQMESMLVASGFTETMRRSRKTVLMRGSMSEEAARALVQSCVGSLEAILADDYHEHLHAPVFVDLPPMAVASRSLAINELRVEDDRVVEGAVVGAVGHLLFVEDTDGRFALDLGELRGRWIEWDPPGPRRRAEAQLGLF